MFLVDTKPQEACLLSWQSKKLRRIDRSTLSAETLAAFEDLDAAIFCQTVISEITNDQPKVPIKLLCVNAFLVEAVCSTKAVTDRRLRVDVGYLREIVNNQSVESILCMPTKDQLADSLTKLKSPASNELFKVIGQFST